VAHPVLVRTATAAHFTVNFLYIRHYPITWLQDFLMEYLNVLDGGALLPNSFLDFDPEEDLSPLMSNIRVSGAL